MFSEQSSQIDYSGINEYPAVGLVPQIPIWSCKQYEVGLFPNQFIRQGTVLSESSTPGVYEPYDGSSEAKGILRFNSWVGGIVPGGSTGFVTVDGPAGFVTGCHWPQRVFFTVPMFVTGIFRTTQLFGLTQNALADLGRLIEGNLEYGIVTLP